MDNIQKIFKDKSKDITFLELKEGMYIEVNDFVIKADLPLPVITDNLIKELHAGELENEIKLEQVIEGIIYLLGVDHEFPHMDKYKEILKAYNDKLNDYIFYKGMKLLESNDLEHAGIYFRALILLDNKNINARFNYALVLEGIGVKYIEMDKEDIGQELLIASTNELETILEFDESYSLAYYKLGYHYRHSELYLKTKIIWTKFLTLDKDESRLQEIREQLDLIEDEVKIETGLTYLTYNDFNKALDSFLRLLPKHNNNWNANYLIALSYKGLEDFDAAIEYLNKALVLNPTEADLYNEAGIIHFIKGEILEAISIFNEGIEKASEDYKLYFNRGLGYVQLGQYNLAITDINKAYEINPYDNNVALHKEEVENLLRSI